MTEVLLPVAIMGIVILLGFLGELIFKKTGVPSVILLLLLGLLIGPVLGLVDAQLFLELSDFFAAIAIIVILFDGGLNLDLYRVLKGAPRGMFLAALSFVVSVLVVTFITLASGFDLFTGILLGSIVGGSSSAIVIPLVSRIKGVSEDTKTVLSIESATTDALGIVIVIALIQAFLLGTGPIEAAQNVASAFSVGAVLGLSAGVIWIQVLRSIQSSEYSYIITIALAFLLYAVTELLSGSGAIAMLLYGITLGNGKALYKMLRYKNPFELNKRTREFNDLIAFFVRSFFFVFMGLLVTFSNPNFVMFGILSVIAIAVIRPSAVQLAIRGMEKKLQIQPMSFMMPRGLAAAVLAFLPMSAGIPNTEWFPDVVFTVILGTTLITTVGTYYMGHKEQFQDFFKNI